MSVTPLRVVSPATGPQPAAATRPTGRRAARRARRREFDGLVERDYPTLVAETTVLVDDRERAEQLVRRALATAWREWRRIRCTADPTDQVRDLVLTRAAQSRGRWWRPGADPTGHIELAAALRRLPDVQRRAIVLHHVLGRSPAQIALDDHVDAETVRRRLAHGAEALAHHHATLVHGRTTPPAPHGEVDPR